MQLSTAKFGFKFDPDALLEWLETANHCVKRQPFDRITVQIKRTLFVKEGCSRDIPSLLAALNQEYKQQHPAARQVVHQFTWHSAALNRALRAEGDRIPF